MRQVLFIIPLSALNGNLPDLPIYGYGLMLFMAFIACNFLAGRLCKREGIEPKLILDMIIWLFVTGIAGARTVYVIQYWHTFKDRGYFEVVKLWDGGLVFYGSIFGGVAGYYAYWWFFLRPRGVSTWKVLDVAAPCIAVGLALGRMGCLFTGCCYGNVACEPYPAIHFPLSSMPASEMIRRGLQTPLGFAFKADSNVVDAVEPGTPVEAAGLQRGDTIVIMNDFLVRGQPDVREALRKLLDAHETTVHFTVLRGAERITLPPFVPTSIGLNPTQIYETISMSLLLFFLLSYYPYKRHHGELMVFMMIGYGIHRYLNEMLRTDTDPVAFGLTLSQNVSILVIALGVVLAFVVWRRPLIADEPPAPAPPTDAPVTEAPATTG